LLPFPHFPLRFLVLSLFFGLSSFSAENPKDFTLKTPEGGAYTLSKQRGKVVVLDFWAIWCVPCREVFPVLTEIRTQFKSEQVSIVGITLDKKPAATVKALAKKPGIGYPVLCDPEGKTAELFGVEALPTLVVISPAGKIIQTKAGISKDEKEALTALIKKNLK